MWNSLVPQLSSFYQQQKYHEADLYKPLRVHLTPSHDPLLAKAQEHLEQAIAQQVFLRDERQPITPPPSAFLRNELSLEDEVARLQAQNLTNPQLFPPWQEHRPTEPQPLSLSQLAEIRQTGTFTVPSDSFPEHSHQWKLSALLASGQTTHSNRLCRGLCWALHHVYAIPRSLFGSGICTLRDSLENIPVVVRDLSGLFVGRPERRLYRSQAELMENRRMEYVLREFTPQIVAWIRERRLHRQEGTAVPVLSGVLVRVDATGADQQLDMRLYDSELYYDVIRVTEGILDAHNRQWQQDRHVLLDSLLRDQAASGAILERDWEETLLKATYTAYYDRLLHALQASEELCTVGGHGMGSLLWAKMQTSHFIQQATDDINQQVQELRQQFTEEVKETHPIRSRASRWVAEQVNRRLHDHFEVPHDQPLARHTTVLQIERTVEYLNQLINRMRNSDMPGVIDKLQQEIYLLQRDAQWRRSESQSALQWIIANMQMPARVFSIPIPFWSPVVLYDSTREAYIRKNARQHLITTDHWFWRSSLAFWRMYASLWHTVVYTKKQWTSSPWCWKALCYRHPFPTAFLLDPKSGRISPTAYAPTLSSRLRTLWQHVHASRAQFEAAPDHGFLGKGISRMIHCLWNYGVKGGLGSCVIVGLVPCGVVMAWVWSLVRLGGGLLWAPLNGILRYLFDIVVYDADNAGSMFYPLFPLLRILLGKFGGGVIIQAVLALALALIIHPACSVLCLTWNVSLALLGYLYDTILFYGVIKPRGRVPPEDTFLARRVAGPGLSMRYYFHLQEEEVLTLLQLQLEQCELSLFEVVASARIQAPHARLESILSTLVDGVGHVSVHEVHKQLQENTDYHQDLLNHQMALRRSLQPRGGHQAYQVRLGPEELVRVLERSTAHVQAFVTNSIFHAILLDSEEWIDRFWAAFDLARDDWEGLTRAYLQEIFSENFLVPLDPEDCSVELHIQHSAFVEPFLEMIREDNPRDDLELANPIHRQIASSGFSSQKLFRGMKLPGAEVGLHSITFLSHSCAARPIQLDTDSYGSP